MASTRPSAAATPLSLEQRAQRLDALETPALAARCLAGLAQLSEVILGPRARHEELLLEALLARPRPAELEALRARPRTEELDALRGELLEMRRELALRCDALAKLERLQLESGDRQLALERELAGLRAERDWRAAEMQAAGTQLDLLRFRLLAPELVARAQRWKAGPP